MSVNTYQTGNIIRLSVSFTNLAGAAVDPTTITFQVQDPSSAQTTIVSPDARIIRDSLGNFHVDYTLPDLFGRYIYRFAGTGSITAAAEKVFVVLHSVF